jgi:hypothetical protein
MAEHCYAACDLCSPSLTLTVAYMPFMLSGIMLSVVMLSIVMVSIVILSAPAQHEASSKC